MVNIKLYGWLLSAILFFSQNLIASSSQHNGHVENTTKDKTEDPNQCDTNDIRCASTVTTAAAPDGSLWRVWTFKQRIYLSQSIDNGQNFLAAKMITEINEKISATGENRIKLGFDKWSSNQQGGIYLSWASPKEKRFTGDVRFSFSIDQGKTFSSPITINDDNLLTGHSFNEMQVTDDGQVSLVWLDGRKKSLAELAGKTEIEEKGSSLYFATANPSKGLLDFKNSELISNTCQCCRIAMSKNQQEQLAIFWRQIYQTNTREFSLLTLDGKNEAHRISFDEWKIDGCPHQGGALSIDANNRYHMVWFNQGEKGKGIFYAYSDDKGKKISQPLSIGSQLKNAVHPHLIHNKNIVHIVWMESNDGVQQLWHQQSNNQGENFSQPKLIAESQVSADRPFLLSNNEQVLVSWQRAGEGHWIKQL